MLTDFHEDKAKEKKKNLKKKIQNGRLKKRSFSSSTNSEYFFQKFHGLVLGLVGLYDAKGMWLNLYGREAVRHKLKTRQKMHFLSF